jgi:RNA polymerase sigma factor FliA
MNLTASYVENETIELEDIVNQHTSLVKRIAHHLAGRLPSTILIDDLIQVGMIGLIEAARNYDVTRGASFTTYSSIRIRGAMLDEVRRNDWTPRSVQQKSRQLLDAVMVVEQRLGREASDHEVAQELVITTAEYYKMLQEVQGQKIFNYDFMESQDGIVAESTIDVGSDPMRELVAEQSRDELAKTISKLPERECLVLSLYYNEELNLREIGEVIGVSESRICQILNQALIRMRSQLGEMSSEET